MALAPLLISLAVVPALLLLIPVVVCLCVATVRGIIATHKSWSSTSTSTAHGKPTPPGVVTFSASVVVLGDIGHSPRTANHAYSLAMMRGGTARCNSVHIVAEGSVSSLHTKLKGLFCGPAALNASRTRTQQQQQQHYEQRSRQQGRGSGGAEMQLHSLRAPPETFVGSKLFLPRSLTKLIKAAYQSYSLLFALTLRAPRTDIAVLQLPPSIPTLPLCLLLFRLQRTRLIVDWHNFGYTLLSLSTGTRHPLTLASKVCEQQLGKFADASICVTAAMRDVLASWGVRAEVFYDRPPDHFRRSTVDEAHALFVKYGLTMGVEKVGALLQPVRRTGDVASITTGANKASTVGTRAELSSSTTLITEECVTMSTRARGGTSFGKTGVEVQHLARGRPAVIVSSTSWTKDEDFSILLDAATIYERELSNAATASKGGRRSVRSHPDLLIAITGKGPEKALYESRLRRMTFKHVNFVTMWLDAEDYPVLLGAADLGVSLHTSSSGLDLPMKVVDMFGCGLPACAASFNCIGELVRDGVDGRLFQNARSLADLLLELLRGFPDEQLPMRTIKEGAAVRSQRRWDDEWMRVVAPIIVRNCCL